MEPNSLQKNNPKSFRINYSQLSFQLSSLKLMQGRLEAQLSSLSSSLITTQSQLKSHKSELFNTKEKISNVKFAFSHKSIQEMSQIKNPNTTLVKLSEIFLILTNEIDESWPKFKKLCKSPEVFLEKVMQLSPEDIPCNFQSTSSLFLDNYRVINLKLKNYPKNVGTLGELIKFLLEFRAKEASLDQGIKENIM
jgi:hypothetical protein